MHTLDSLGKEKKKTCFSGNFFLFKTVRYCLENCISYIFYPNITNYIENFQNVGQALTKEDKGESGFS